MNNVISIARITKAKTKTEKIIRIEETNQLSLLFWVRVNTLHKAMKNAEHEDMQNLWKWKLIELMKKIPNKI